MSRIDSRRLDDPDSTRPEKIAGDMYSRYSDLDLCIHQGVGGLGCGRQLDDHLGGGHGNVRSFV